MRKACVLLLFCACATVASAQVAEFSISGGTTRIGGNPIITDPTAGAVDLDGGFRLAIRMTINTWRFMGHEFGYGYSHTNLTNQGQTIEAVPIHQGFYDFMVYATPEGSHIRPFACGGLQFSSFFPPGTSIYYGNQITKFGFNYGGGLKFRLKGAIGARVDLRQYNMGKPDFGFTVGPSGRLTQTEITVGLSYNL